MRKKTIPDTRQSYIIPFIFLIVTAAMLIVGYLNYHDYAQYFRKEVEKQLSAITALKVAEIVQWRKERFADAQTIYKNPNFSKLVRLTLQEPADAEAQRMLQLRLNKFQAYPDYTHIFLVDTQGVRRLTASLKSDQVPVSYSYDIAEVLRLGTIQVLDLHHQTRDNTIYITMLVPVFDERNSRLPLGAIIIQINPEVYLYPLLNSWPTFSATAETLIIRRDGPDALFLNELRFKKDAALNLRIPLTQLEIPAVLAALGQEGIVEGLDYRGEPVIADVRRIPDSPWFMVARMDTAEVYAPLRERQKDMAAIFFVLLLSAFLGLLLFWRQQRIIFYRTQLSIERDKSWLQDIISRSLNEIYVFDSDTLCFTFANTGALRNIGYSMEELSRLKPSDIKPEYSEEALRAALQPLLAGDQDMLIFETLHCRKNGTCYPVEIHLQCVEAGKGLVFLGVVNDISERKQAEKNLKNSEQRQKLILNNIPDMAWLKDAAGKLIAVNDPFAKACGSVPAKISGKTDLDLWPPELADKYRADDLQVMQSGRRTTIEETMIDKDGNQHWLETIKTPFSDSTGKIVGTAAIARDITARRHAEQALRKSEDAVKNKLKAILEPEGDIASLELFDIVDSKELQQVMEDFYRIMPVASAIGDLAGKMLASVGWQDICTKFHRCSPESLNNCIESDTIISAGVSEGEFKSYLCKNNLWDLASPIIIGGRHVGNVFIGQFFYEDKLPDVDVFRKQARLHGFPEKEYLEALDKVPVLSHETVNAAMAFYVKLAGMISKLSYSAIKLSRSIAEQKQGQEIISRQAKISSIFLTSGDEEMYSQVLNVVLDVMKSPFGVFGYIDEAGALVVPSMTRAIWDKCQVRNKAIRFPQETWGDSSWPRAIREKKFNFSNEPSRKIPDGHVNIFRHITVPIMIGNTVIGLFQIANKQTDYTDDDIQVLQNIAQHVAPILSARISRDVHEKNLQKRNDELARFSYAISHDLKSPLVTIQTFLGYLKKDFHNQDTEKIDKDFSFIHGASAKMSRLLDELLDLTRIGIVENPVTSASLQDIVREAQVLVSGRIAERGVKIKLTDKPLMLTGDRVRLVEVFQNLFDNAVKFMGNQTEPLIEIGFEKKNSETLLFVCDNGMGIDVQYQEKLFGLFEILNPSLEGTGIGLALVKRIIEVHNGRIWVESAGTGQGSCFWFTLPGKGEK